MSKSKRLTDVSVRNLKPRDAAYARPDGGNGLYCVVQPSGHKSWATMYRIAGRQAKLVLGRYPEMGLAAARIAAIEARESAKAGVDPSRARREKKIAAAVAAEDTVTAICSRFLETKGAKLRSIDHQRSMLRRLVFDSALGEMPVEQVKRSDIVKTLDKIEAKAGARSADMCLSILRQVFNWHALRSDDFRTPIVPGMGRYRYAEHRGERILSDAELRQLWETTADGTTFAQLVRFLLLTSARKSEAAGLRRAEIDGDIWTLPASRSKTGKAVERPLSGPARRIIDEMPQIDGCPWVFSGSSGLSPFNNFSDATAALRKRSGVQGWRVHDLRRTSRSFLSRAGVNVDTAERCLGHVIGGVRAVYDHHSYIEEMRFAFEALAALIQKIVNPPEGGAVIDLQGERAARR
jgi:integrase